MSKRPTRGHRHTARALGMSGIPAARYITPQPAALHDTAPLFLPGLHPALAR